MRPLLHCFIKAEQKLRHMSHPHAMTEFRTNEWGSACQPFERFLFFLFAPVDAEEDLGVSEIVGDIDIGDRNEPDPRILDLPHQDIGNFLFHLVAYAHGTFKGWLGHGFFTLQKSEDGRRREFHGCFLNIPAACSALWLRSLRVFLSGNPAGSVQERLEPDQGHGPASG